MQLCIICYFFLKDRNKLFTMASRLRVAITQSGAATSRSRSLVTMTGSHLVIRTCQLTKPAFCFSASIPEGIDIYTTGKPSQVTNPVSSNRRNPRLIWRQRCFFLCREERQVDQVVARTQPPIAISDFSIPPRVRLRTTSCRVV
jgi:hypothetical protein